VPIYAYRCQSCGFAKDVLQKISDPVLTQCPECQQQTFAKQLTAAGFQLKGTGWYVTDFRDGQKKPATTPAEGTAKAEGAAKADTPAKADSGAAKTETSATPASSTSAGSGDAAA
jgi:putative FmdB family regulatory protein